MKIVFDTETTGFPKNGVGLSEQPYMIEYAGMKLDDDYKEVDRLEFQIKIPIDLPEKITEITKITAEDLVDCKPFKEHYNDLVNFHAGVDTLIAHNLEFDMQILEFDLRRLNKFEVFKFPAKRICTMKSQGFKKAPTWGSKWLKLDALHRMATGEGFDGAHRAMVDVEATVRCVRWLAKSDYI